MLGMYVHTHWSYNHPYCARTWTATDWEAYLTGLAALGYDTVMIWPQLETMPVPPTESDRGFLQVLRHAIDFAHERLGMKMIIATCPNIMANEAAAGFEFARRYFWDCCRYVDPGDAAGVEEFRQARRALYRELSNMDALSVIDSDAGGWPDTPSEAFLDFFLLHSNAAREANADAELYYWMWGGWPENMHLETYLDTLGLMKERVEEPWKILACSDLHRAAAERTGLTERMAYYPYGTVEYEPTFPMTNSDPPWFRQQMQRYDARVYPQGLMVNCQTHCLQMPYTYLAAHYARGGSYATENLPTFAQELVRGTGGNLVHSGWYHMEEERDYLVMRHYSAALRKESEGSPELGPLGGMVMMPAAQFLLDVADNLDLRADFIQLRTAVDAGHEVKPALRRVLGHLRPYQERLGYNYFSQHPLQRGLLDQIRRLEIPVLREAVDPPGGKLAPGGTWGIY